MKRREFIASAASYVGASLFLPARGWAAEPAGATRKPNIVLIFADDQGYADLGCQGCKDIPTPNMDAIAANGVRCTDGYVTAPVCSPSRAGLLTGRYQQRFGHEHNPGAQPEAGLPLTEKTLADRLRAAGYATGMVGKWHLGMLPEQNPVTRGFDEFYGFLHGAHPYLEPSGRRSGADPIRRGLEPVEETEYLTDAIAREAVSFIERHRTEPFFLYVPFNAVHTPLEASAKYLARFPGIHDEKRRTFAAMLSAMDDAVGAILRKLRETGLEKNTLLFYVSDNGGPTNQTTASNAPLRGYKAQMYEGGIRIPYLVQWPGRLPAGTVYSEPVSSLDVLPTALAAGGLQPPDAAQLDGVDLLPYLTGRKTGSPHEALFWRMGSGKAMRRGRWKLVSMRGAPFELYDLSADIGEQHDLAGKKPEIRGELTRAYAEWEEQMVAPLWVRKSFGSDGNRGRRGERQGRGTGIDARFDQMDANHDGILTPNEVPRAETFRRLDRDGNGKVTLDEARTALSGRARPGRQE